MLGISLRSLDEHINSGELPASRLNSKAVRILREDLLDFLRSNRSWLAKNRKPAHEHFSL
jgi:hypothetical protein